MLRVMARRADQLPGEIEREAQAPVLEIEIKFARIILIRAFAAPTPDEAGETRRDVLRQAERFADLTHRAARPVTGS